MSEPRGHHGQICHHVGVEEKGLERAEGIADPVAPFDNLLISSLGVDVPLPGVLEGANLGTGLRAVLLRKQDVIVLARVERRVKIDQVDRLVFHVSAEDVEVVAVI